MERYLQNVLEALAGLLKLGLPQLKREVLKERKCEEKRSSCQTKVSDSHHAEATQHYWCEGLTDRKISTTAPDAQTRSILVLHFGIKEEMLDGGNMQRHRGP